LLHPEGRLAHGGDYISEAAAGRLLGIRALLMSDLLDLDVLPVKVAADGSRTVRHWDVKREIYGGDRGTERLRPGWVYFIQGVDGGPIKIGTTDNVRSRLRAIQAMNWAELRLLTCYPGFSMSERHLHRRFKEHRVRGEWFAINPELSKLIDDVHALKFDPELER
jgi:hypothetical protein